MVMEIKLCMACIYFIKKTYFDFIPYLFIIVLANSYTNTNTFKSPLDLFIYAFHIEVHNTPQKICVWLKYLGNNKLSSASSNPSQTGSSNYKPHSKHSLSTPRKKKKVKIISYCEAYLQNLLCCKTTHL